MSLKEFETIFVKSIGKTKELLLPFSFKKWIVLAFIAMLAGAIGGGGVGSFNVNLPSGGFGRDKQIQNTTSNNTSKVSSEAEYRNEGTMLGSTAAKDMGESYAFVIAAFLIGLFIIFVVPFWLFLLWINGRFSFIFYNSTVFNTTAIKIPWAKYKTLGNSLFKAKALLLLVVFTVALILGGLGYSSVSYGGYINLFWLVPLIVFYLIVIFVVFHYVDQFIVPIMAIEGKQFKQALAKFRDLFYADKKLFIVYLFVAMGMGIASGVILGLLGLLLALLFLIIGLIVFGGAYAVFGFGLVFGIICTLLGIPFILALIISIFICVVPIAYFYRNFTLYYLMESPCDYDFFAERESSETEVLSKGQI